MAVEKTHIEPTSHVSSLLGVFWHSVCLEVSHRRKAKTWARVARRSSKAKHRILNSVFETVPASGL